MGTLGQYLREARESRGIDLRDAAQQTRIGLSFLKALEEEDFSKLPGEVFVKGFLKNYGKFLRLSEPEIMKRYAEVQPSKSAPVAAPKQEREVTVNTPQKAAGFPVEPFIWGVGIVIILVIFLFTALPARRPREVQREAPQQPQPQAGQFEPVPVTPASDKLYLEVIALENTWLLIRTDNSPQKKAVLKKGESLIWSAGERFHIGYGSVGALKLQLNGQELEVHEPKQTVVRDMEINAHGIVEKKVPSALVKKTNQKQTAPVEERVRPAVSSTQSPTRFAPPQTLPRRQ